ncbi:hypothetical protein B5M09_011867, partial [Aphanomyces astaci]
AHAIALSSLQLPHGTPCRVHPAARSVPTTHIHDTSRLGQVLTSKALGLEWVRNLETNTATLAFLRQARIDATFRWERSGRYHCHMTPALQTAARLLQRSLRYSTTEVGRSLLWHTQLQNKSWIRDHCNKALKPHSYDTFTHAFSATKAGDTWTFNPEAPPTACHEAQLQYYSLTDWETHGLPSTLI